MAKRILIADDDAMTREMLSEIARSRGYEVISVNDGTEILNVVYNDHIDVIITDLMMANLSGASASGIMKMQDITTPLIALTALTPEETLNVEDIFVKIFHKPCNFLELFDYVDALIGK
jgi:DNA-binding response OmpR family regulator